MTLEDLTSEYEATLAAIDDLVYRAIGELEPLLEFGVLPPERRMTLWRIWGELEERFIQAEFSDVSEEAARASAVEFLGDTGMDAARIEEFIDVCRRCSGASWRGIQAVSETWCHDTL